MKVKSYRKYFAMVAILILFTTPILSSYHPAFAASSTGIMIPLYSYPGSYWTQVIQAKNAHPSVPIVVIINPNNGPGTSIDSNYVNGIQQLQAAGITVLGYVYTSYGARSASSIESDISAYNSWYHVNGINFDEMANTAGFETYYSNLSSYAKSLGMTMTVGNPGTDTLSSYIGTVDVLDIYENPGLPTLSDLEGWHTSYPKPNFAFVAFGVTSLPSQSAVTTDSSYVGYMYITDDILPNPYDTVPSYLSTEVGMLDTGSTTTVPSSPTALTATTATSSQINLSWTAPANNGGSAITGYKIERSTDGGTTWSTIQSNTGSTSTTYSDTGLAASTTYTYRVSAINSVGTSPPSNIASTTTSSGGGTGGTIAINNIQKTSGTVSSSPYQITLSNFNAGTSLLVVGVEANNNVVSSVTFGSIQLTKAISSFSNNDAEFWYLVNPSGTGNIVVTMAGSTSAVVGAYSLLGVDLTSPIPTTVSNHNSASSSPSISITTKYSNSLVLDSASIYGGVTLGSPTCTQEWNANIQTAITGASSSRIVSSPGSTTCSWTASGGGDLWDDVAIEVKASSTGGTATAPGSPTALTAAAASSSQINLSWTAPSNNGGSVITGYKIERSTDGGTTWSTIQSNTASTATTYSNTGLAAGATYTYRVSAINAVGISSTSNTASATTNATAPGSPTGLTATTISSSQINLSWTAPANNGGSAITGYKIERSTNGGTTWSILVANTASAATTYSNTGLAKNTTYSYRISAINSVGTSSPSNIASATTSSSVTTKVTITVNALDQLGNVHHMYIDLENPSGSVIATGYTPVSFSATSGQQYIVYANNYQTTIFNHWDDGTTNPARSITPTKNLTITAYYTAG